MIKSLNFIVRISGQGVVNFDGQHGSYWAGGDSKTKNQKFAKTVVTKTTDDNGKNKFDRRIKISANSLRNAIFKEDVPFQTSHMFCNNVELWPNLIANKTSLLRGYLLTNESGLILKRKGPLMVTDAIQVSNSVLKQEVASTSGMRTETSFYETDSIGNVEYEAKGSIDIGELGFWSCDPIFDRPGFLEDSYVSIKNAFADGSNGKMPHYLEDKPNFYTKTSSIIKVAELGILIPKDLMFEIIVEAFDHLLGAVFLKNTAYAMTDSVAVYATKLNEHGLKFSGEPLVILKKNDDVESLFRALINLDDLYQAYIPAKDSEVNLNSAAQDKLKSMKTIKEKKKKNAKKQEENALDEVE